jgi:hypothetical protein
MPVDSPAARALGDWMQVVARRFAWAPVLVFSVHVVLSRVLHAYATLPRLRSAQ